MVKNAKILIQNHLPPRPVLRADIPVEVANRETSDSGSKGWCYLPFPTAESRVINGGDCSRDKSLRQVIFFT